MSRKRAPRRSGKAAPPPRARRHPRAWLALVPLAAGLAGWGAWTSWEASAPPSPATVSEIERLTGRTAYERAVDSAQAGQILGSLPYFRRAASLEPQAPHVHLDYGRALFATGYERRADSQSPLRSSVERVAMMREALHEMELADQPSAPRPLRAEALGTTGEMLMLWGFPVEGFAMYRQAEDAEPANRERALRARASAMVLRDPERYPDGRVPIANEPGAQ